MLTDYGQYTLEDVSTLKREELESVEVDVINCKWGKIKSRLKRYAQVESISINE